MGIVNNQDQQKRNELINFVEQVTNIVQRQLLEFDPHAVFQVHLEQNLFQFSGYAFQKPISFSILMEEVRNLRIKSPFALDQWIWEQLQRFGIHIKEPTHYLQTVNILSNIQFPAYNKKLQLDH